MLPQINLLHLRFFRDAVVYSSISEAARMNYVTQSAVSQGIAKLEKILGSELFTHNSRQKIQLTEEGKLVFEHVKVVFDSIQQIHDKLHNNKQKMCGTINFISTKSLGVSYLPAIYKKIHEDFPNLQVHVELGGLNYIRNAIKQGDAEFGIVMYDHNFLQFEKRLLKKGFFGLYESTKKIDKRFKHDVLINNYEGSFVPELQEFLANSSDLKVRNSLSGWDVVARMADAQLGIGFVPDYILYDNRYPLLRQHSLQLPPFEYEICAIFNKGAVLSRAAEFFIQSCEKQFP